MFLEKTNGERFFSGGIMGEQACTGLKRYAAGCQGVRLINSGIDQKGKIWLCRTVSWVILMRQEIFSKEEMYALSDFLIMVFVMVSEAVT